MKQNGHKRYRDYTAEERAAAIALVEANGGNVNGTAKQLSISEPTLRSWIRRNDESHELYEEKKVALADMIEAAVREMINASDGKIKDANFQQLWTSVGIGIDKRQLLLGQATSIIASNLTAKLQKDFPDIPEDTLKELASEWLQ